VPRVPQRSFPPSPDAQPPSAPPGERPPRLLRALLGLLIPAADRRHVLAEVDAL